MAAAAWLEVSLTVDGEMAEAVAEVLSRFAPNGVVIETTKFLQDSEGDVEITGPLRVAAYLPVDENIEETRRKLEESLWYLGRIRPLPQPQFRPIEQANWAEAWKQHYHPVEIGSRLIIVPAWLDSPSPERIPIRIDPGMAFGTGTHPTTQLCLEMVEDFMIARQGPQAASEVEVIDVGCGSGILSIAALKLGAGHALGVDIDAEAIDAAQENVTKNGVADRFEAGIGSLEEVRSGKFSITRGSLVLANILAVTLVRLLDQGLGDLLSPAGVLVLSGILEEQAAEVTAAAGRNGLRLVEQRQIGDWVAQWVMRAEE